MTTIAPTHRIVRQGRLSLRYLGQQILIQPIPYSTRSISRGTHDLRMNRM